MKIGRPAQGWRPTFQQELLLRAALSRGDEVLTSWLRWKGCTDLDSLDGGSARLLPLVYRNLGLHGVEDPDTERLKAEYVHTWCHNEILFDELAALLRTFQAEGVETLVLKGAALALHFYKDAGLRPMSDVDVLVRPGKAHSAIRLLHRAGWKTIYESPEVLIPYQHAVEFSDGRGHRLDLHWKVLWDGRQEISDDVFWEGAVPIEINGVPTSTPGPTAHLLHVCVHGAAWNDLPPLRWVADAVTVLRTAGTEIDWDGLIRQVRARRLMLPMRDALGYLQSFPDAHIPADVLRTVRGMPASYKERVLYRIRSGRNRRLRKINVLYYWYGAWRLSDNPRPLHKFSEFIRYLRCFGRAKFSPPAPPRSNEPTRGSRSGAD